MRRSDITNPVKSDWYGTSPRSTPPLHDLSKEEKEGWKAGQPPTQREGETVDSVTYADRVRRVKEHLARRQQMEDDMVVGAENYNAVKNFISKKADLHRKKGLSPAAARAAAMADAEEKFGNDFLHDAAKGAGLPGGPGSSSVRPSPSMSDAFSRASSRASSYRSDHALDSFTPEFRREQQDIDKIEASRQMARQQEADRFAFKTREKYGLPNGPPEDNTLAEALRELDHASAQKLVDKVAKTNPKVAKKIFDVGKSIGYSMTRFSAPTNYGAQSPKPPAYVSPAPSYNQPLIDLGF